MSAVELRSRARDHLRSPLTRSGYALLLSSGITSVLGLLYWFLAARVFEEGELGRGAALVSAMILITSLATAGLKRGLIRFIPSSGSRARRLTVRVYAVGLGLAVAFAVVLLSGFDSVEDRMAALHQHRFAPALFIVAVVAWACFVLQDAVLIGVRRAGLVPTNNAVFSVLKIVLLLAFAVLIDHEWGVFLSWVVPAALTAIVVNGWLFRRGLRRSTDEPADPPTLGQVVRFTGGEYVAALVWQAAIYVTPLIVLARVGAVANAHWYVPSQIAYAFFLVSSNVCDALVAEGALAQHDLAAKVRRASAQTALLMVPGVVVAVLAAHPIMRAFGAGYAGSAARTLQLLALASVPNAVTTVVIAVAHVRQRMWHVVVIQTVMAGLTLGLGVALVDGHGVVGVATGWLIAQTLTAFLAVSLSLRAEHGLARATRVWLVAQASHLRARVSEAQARRELRRHLAVVPKGALPEGKVGLLGHQHDVLVLGAGSASVPLVVRVATGTNGRRVIRAHHDAMQHLHDDPRLAPVARLAPDVLAIDEDDRWLVETRLRGRPAREVAGEVGLDVVTGTALDMLEQLHSSTARQVVTGPDEVDRWVHEPVAVVAGALQDATAVAGLAVLHERLTDELGSRPVSVARLHGDPSLDNVLVSDDGRRVTGAVDWEASREGLPELDVIALVLARRRLEHGQELGEEIVDLLENGWSPAEREVLGRAWSVNAHVRPTTLVLLTWLTHVADNLRKAERYEANGWWLHHNVEQVLVALARDAGVTPAVATVPGPVTGPEPTAGSGPVDRPARRLPPAVAAGAALSAGAAYGLAGGIGLRIPLVCVATLVLPTAAIATRVRGTGRRDVLRTFVLAVAGAVAMDVMIAEALLYAHLWSPGLFLAVVSALVVGSTLPSLSAPTDPTPSHVEAAPGDGAEADAELVIDLRDAVLDVPHRGGPGR